MQLHPTLQPATPEAVFKKNIYSNEIKSDSMHKAYSVLRLKS